jgi:hypothetical protein
VIYTTVQDVWIKRNIRPLYAFTQATPKQGFLDPAWDRSSPLYPGMALMKTSGDLYAPLNGTGVPAGILGQFLGGYGIDEALQVGLNAIAVWVMGPDAEFQILAPAFDAAQTWTDPGNGTDALIFAYTASVNGVNASTTSGLEGQLAPAGAATAALSTQPVARLISVDSPSQITIGGLAVRHGF